MFVSGFTIIRNGVQFDFPFLESIKSALPLCDEFVINVGESEDGTLEAIQTLKRELPASEGAKIQIFETKWPLDDKTKRFGGQILADQTNLALDRCKGRWCFYLQADEVLHEEDLPKIIAALEAHDSDASVEAAVFSWVHFYGNYNVVQTSRSSYRREIRIVRGGMGIRSTGDAQSFRHSDGRKLAAILLDARIYHYGWVRPPEVMKKKTGFMDTLYHSGAKADVPATGANYQYKRIVGLKPFQGTHPAVMTHRVSASPVFDFSSAPKVFHWKDTWKVLSGWYESITGHRPFEFKNYRLIK